MTAPEASASGTAVLDNLPASRRQAHSRTKTDSALDFSTPSEADFFIYIGLAISWIVWAIYGLVIWPFLVTRSIFVVVISTVKIPFNGGEDLKGSVALLHFSLIYYAKVFKDIKRIIINNESLSFVEERMSLKSHLISVAGALIFWMMNLVFILIMSALL